MKLNYDCIRSLLIYLESNLNYDNQIKINDLSLDNFENIDLLYTADKLNEAGFINCVKGRHINNPKPLIIVKSITYTGHKLLDNIRDEQVYSETKNVLSKFKSVSIDIFSETASKVISSLISKQLGISN